MNEEKELSTFQKKLNQRREAEAAAAARKESAVRVKSVTETGWAEDLIPGMDRPRTDTDTQLDRLFSGIGVIEAYHKWCGKMRVDKRRRTVEGIKVSCPIPGHTDSNPSAWVNTDKNVWFCARCDQGGDVFDLAAFHYGFAVPGYKEGGNFHDLRKKMAESYGFTFVDAPGLDRPMLVAPEDKKPAPAATAKTVVTEAEDDSPTDAEILALDGHEAAAPLPALDWEKLVREETFLAKYMDICTEDDAPEEYHFWNGILALGLAVGRDVVLHDQKPVLPNLFVCLLGPTGDGKSRSIHHLQELMHQALPYKYDDPAGKGVESIDSPASAEALISAFVNPVYDPVDAKKVAGFAPVRGLIEFNELASLVGRASRKGNVLKPTLMSFYDGQRVVSTMSMTHGKKRAENPFGSLLTTAQPKALKDLLREGDASSGFLNRIVFATGTPKRRIAVGGASIDMRGAVDPLQRVQGWAGFGRMIPWHHTGETKFTEFFHEVLYPKQLEDDSGLLDRMDLLAKKLILLLAINEGASSVNAELVDKVIGMFSYLTAAYGVPAAHIGSTINSEVRDEILKHIDNHSKKSGGITMRRLMLNLKRKNFPLDVVAKTLKHLSDLGFIHAEQSTGVGRPTVKYKSAHD